MNNDILEKIYWLLEDGKRYGTLPFAGLARAGFIAVQMLKSFVDVGIFSDEDYEKLQKSYIEEYEGSEDYKKDQADKNAKLPKIEDEDETQYKELSPSDKEDLYAWARSRAQGMKFKK